MKKKIAILTGSDLSSVQGSTEPHYVISELSSKYQIEVISPYDPELRSVSYRSIPAPGKASLFVYNFILLPYLFYIFYRDEFDIIYTYKQFHVVPYVISTIVGADWVVDLRTSPVEQEMEFSTIQTSSRAIAYIKYLYYSINRFIYSRTLPFSDSIICVSEPVKRKLESSYDIDSGKLFVVPLGVDVNRFYPRECDKTPSEPYNIVYVGAISKVRGFDKFISLISSGDLAVDINVHLIGPISDEYRSQLIQKMESEGIRSQVELYGYVEHQHLQEVMAKMDIAISPLPPHESYEDSSPAKIYEYLAMGLPILCTDIQAHRTILDQSSCAVFYDYDSEKSLTARLNDLKSLDRDSWNEMREAARRQALENSWSQRVNKISSVIEQL